MAAVSTSLKLGWLMASQNTAGTEVRVLMRSSLVNFKKVCTLNVGMITVVPPPSHATRNWLLQPVTGDSGTATSGRMLPSKARWLTRRQGARVARNASCLAFASHGEPVVPLG